MSARSSFPRPSAATSRRLAPSSDKTPFSTFSLPSQGKWCIDRISTSQRRHGSSAARRRETDDDDDDGDCPPAPSFAQSSTPTMSTPSDHSRMPTHIPPTTKAKRAMMCCSSPFARALRLLLPLLVAALSMGGAAGLFSGSKDLNQQQQQKKGAVLYTASYVNQPNTRTRAVFAGNFSSYDGSTVPFNGLVRLATIFNVEVFDKKKTPMPWVNIYVSQTSDFPASVIPPSFGMTPGNNLVSHTYQLTALDKDSQALLGSLVFGGAWDDGSDSGTSTNLFPVLGATGVYRKAKTVSLTYETSGARSMVIYKTAF